MARKRSPVDKALHPSWAITAWVPDSSNQGMTPIPTGETLEYAVGGI